MSHAAGSSRRLWTLERFLTRQVDKSEMWRQRVFKGSVFQVASDFRQFQAQECGVDMRGKSGACCYSVPLWKLNCTFQCLKIAILSGFLRVKDNVEGF